MDFNKKVLMALLAVFCVIVSAGAICAAEDANSEVVSESGDGDAVLADNENVNDDGNNDQDVSGDNDYDGSQGPDVVPPQDNLNETNNTTNVTANATGNATGEPTQNVTDNSTGNATHQTGSNYVTGNPILALLAVSAVAGGIAVYRKK